MNELVQSYTSLPNLHPALVHFPIALLPVALLFDLLGLATQQRWLARSATLLWALAFLGAGAAYWAGRQAADALVGVPAQVQVHIGTHSDWALYTLWTLGVVAGLRLAVTWHDRHGDRLSLRLARWGLLAAGLVALGLVMFTADLGGGLVYQHGIAEFAEVTDEHAHDAPVKSADEEQRPKEVPIDTTAEPGPATDRLVKNEDGTLLWSPLPDDGEALGTVLSAAPGSSLDAVTVAEPVSDGEGLRLTVNGRSLLVLPGTFGDVQVDARLDLSAFAGSVGLIHHVQSAETAGLFIVSTSGTAALVVLEDGKTETLDEQDAELTSTLVTLAVSSSGRHLKGLIEGKAVTHGHVSPGAAGGCGLLLDGNGTIGVVSVRLTPLG